MWGGECSGKILQYWWEGGEWCRMGMAPLHRVVGRVAVYYQR